MKPIKAFGLLFTMMFLATMSACGKTEESSVLSETTETIEVLRDLTVEAENVCTLPDASDTDIGEITMNCQMDYAISAEPETLAENSTAIVSATIQTISYVMLEDTVWTKMDVLVSTSSYGDLQTGDLISVYSIGGCAMMSDYFDEETLEEQYGDWTEEEIANTVITDLQEGVALPTVEEEYLFFLTTPAAYESLPDGAYEVLIGYANGMYVETDGIYVNELHEESITPTEMTQLVQII